MPVAAGIYALGFRMMIDDTDLTQTSDLGRVGFGPHRAAGPRLGGFRAPGLIKFTDPAAAAGSRGFSGGEAQSRGGGSGSRCRRPGRLDGSRIGRRGAGVPTAGGAGGDGASEAASGGGHSAGVMAPVLRPLASVRPAGAGLAQQGVLLLAEPPPTVDPRPLMSVCRQPIRKVAHARPLGHRQRHHRMPVRLLGRQQLPARSARTTAQRRGGGRWSERPSIVSRLGPGVGALVRRHG